MNEKARLLHVCEFRKCADLFELKQILERHPEWLRERWGGDTLLHRAANREIADYLLEQGLPIDAKSERYHCQTPLLTAIERGIWDVVELLIERGADLFAREKSGDGALEKALYKGNVQLAEFLMDRGVTVQVEGAPNPALVMAAQNGTVELVKRLLEKGADVNAVKKFGGETALHHAVKRADPVMIRVLLEAGADPNGREPNPLVWLVESMEKNLPARVKESLRLLLEAGADPDMALFRLFDNMNRTPFSLKKEVFFMLQKYGADPTVHHGGQTIIHKMARHSPQWIPVMERLPGFHAMVRMRDRRRRLPQHYASSQEMFDFLARASGNQGDKRILPNALGQDKQFGEIISLHPQRDELLVVHAGGKLSRWRYAPHLQLVEAVQTEQCEIHDLAISPDGRRFAMTGEQIWGVELREFEGLSVLRRLTGDGLKDFYRLSWTPDGTRILAECTHKGTGTDGAGWFHVETGKSLFKSSEEIGYEDEEWIGTMNPWVLAPDGKWWATVHQIDDDPDLFGIRLYLFPTPFSGNPSSGPLVFELPALDHVYGLVFHPDSSLVFCYVRVFMTNYISDSTPREDRLIACSISEKRILWNVTVTPLPRRKNKETIKTTRLLASENEVVCATPEGKLIFFDVETGTLLREVPVNGEKILAIGLHPDGDKFRVATDREMQVVEWK